MASPSLLALLDDITAVLDDVASMTKLASKKTAGVLSDDLAVNAQQVSGVQANRELPVIWSVAKGSFINKLLIIPAALLINHFAPWLMVVLLVIGGAYLCFEGAEKIHHTLFHRHKAKHAEQTASDVIVSDEMIKSIEKDKIKGAIRTDFILSAEIIVITLHTVSHHTLPIQIMTLLSIAVLITVGVYGFVAGIIKMDDVGYWMLQNAKKASLRAKTGLMLINAAPYLMKILAFIGTIAMFLVGGGIIIGEVAQLKNLQSQWLITLDASFFKHFVSTAYSLVLGFIVGYVVLIGHSVYGAITKKAH